jgi:hypothetical protein
MLRTAVIAAVVSAASIVSVRSDDGPHLAGGIRLRLTSTNNEFVNGEVLWFDLMITNPSPEALTIPIPTQRYGYLKIRLQNESGQYLAGRPEPFRFGPMRRTVLAPNQTRTTAINLNGYGEPDQFTGVVREFRPGTYRVWIEFFDLSSNVVEFRIIEPSGNDRLIQSQFKNLRRQERTHKAIIQESRRLIRDYPNTRYLMNIYWSLFAPTWKAGGVDSVTALAEEVIDRFQNHVGMTNQAVSQLIAAYFEKNRIKIWELPSTEDRDAIVRMVLQVSERYRNTKVADAVEEQLEHLRNKWEYHRQNPIR